MSTHGKEEAKRRYEVSRSPRLTRSNASASFRARNTRMAPSTGTRCRRQPPSPGRKNSRFAMTRSPRSSDPELWVTAASADSWT